MEAEIIIQGKKDPPRLKPIAGPMVDFSKVAKITFCLIEGGMASGDPSVMMICGNDSGTVITQTSLDKFLTVANGFVIAAETHWGWTLPDGVATIMPPDRETRKALLEQIKSELEGWDEVEEE